jgi:diacylglycerol kinase (ATP)
VTGSEHIPTCEADEELSALRRSTRFSWRARLSGFSHALDGLRLLLRHEHNAWIHLAATLLVMSAASAARLSWSDWRWLVAAIALVWLAEAFNTAIEQLCNRVSPGPDPVIKRVKDLAAGAVLIASAAAALIGFFTLFPHLPELPR